MGVDLHEMAKNLKEKNQVGVDREGRLSNTNPHNDGTSENTGGLTNLKPKKFFLA